MPTLEFEGPMVESISSFLKDGGDDINDVTSDYAMTSSIGYNVDGSGGLNWTRLDELRAMRLQTIFVVQKILYPTVVCFGCIGNFLAIVVLTRRWMKSSTNRYLTALAIYDILYLTFALTMSFQHYPSISTHPLYVQYKAFVGRTLTNVWSNTGIWLTVTFTVERFVVVCCPMKGKVWCTPTRAKHTVAGVCVAAALITVPEIFSRTVTERFDTATNATRLVEEPTQFGNSTAYLLGYQYANQALFTFLPLVLLSIFNTLLIRALVTAAKQRDVMTYSRACAATSNARSASGGSTACPGHDQQRVTLMLVCIVIVFIVCQLPSAFAILYMNFVKRSTTEERRLVLLSFGSVFNLLVMINSAVNFIFYSVFSSRFRATFRRIFCRYRHPDSSPDTQTTHFPHPIVNASPRTLTPSPYYGPRSPRHPPPPSPRCQTGFPQNPRESRDFITAGSRDVSPCHVPSSDVTP